MKRDLEKLIQGTAEAARAWAYAAGPGGRLPAEGLRPAFVAHRLVCALAEMEELLAVHRTLWPQDQTWRARHGESMVDRMGPRADLKRLGAEVAEEERPDPALAQSQDIGDLFEFFCQIRKSILFDSDSADAFVSASDTRSAIEAAMGSVRTLDRSRRAALEQALSGFVSNSFMHSPARLPNGAVLGERYWPLFRAVRLLRGEAIMNIEEIHGILDDAEIRPETRDRVRRLIDELRRVLSDYDIDRIRDILASGGQLFPGMGEQSLELGVLRLELTQPLRVGRLHAAEPRAPLVERRVAEAAAAAHLGHRHPSLGLLEEPNDLFLAEFALPHVRHSPDERTSLPLPWYGGWGAGHTLTNRHPIFTASNRPAMALPLCVR